MEALPILRANLLGNLLHHRKEPREKYESTKKNQPPNPREHKETT